jgi:hypothetical protein
VGQNIFHEIDQIFRESRKRGVIVEEEDPETGEEMVIRIKVDEHGNQIREQLFPPPEAPKRVRLRSVSITAPVVLVVVAVLVAGYGLARSILGLIWR